MSWKQRPTILASLLMLAGRQLHLQIVATPFCRCRFAFANFKIFFSFDLEAHKIYDPGGLISLYICGKSTLETSRCGRFRDVRHASSIISFVGFHSRFDSQSFFL